MLLKILSAYAYEKVNNPGFKHLKWREFFYPTVKPFFVYGQNNKIWSIMSAIFARWIEVKNFDMKIKIIKIFGNDQHNAYNTLAL